MATLSSFRQKHPEYDDMSDQDLADRLHKKFYSDIPVDKFYQDLGLRGASSSSMSGAFGRGAVRGVAPAAGGFAGAVAGAEAGAGLGLLGGPADWLTVPLGGLAGGVAGAMGGGYAVQKGQDWVLSKLPDGVRSALGQSEAQQQQDIQEHPYASLAGEFGPQALFMGPGAVGRSVPEAASAFEKLAASPYTSRAIGAGLSAGQQAGMEYAQTGQVDLGNVGIAGIYGAALNRPWGLGERIASPIGQAFHGPGITPGAPQGPDVALFDALTQASQSGEAPPPATIPGEAPIPAEQMPPENNITAIQRKMTGEPQAPVVVPAEEASPSQYAVPEGGYQSVIADRLAPIARSSPAGKSFVDDLTTKMGAGEVDPTQAYFAITHIGDALHRVLGGTDTDLTVKLLPELLTKGGEQAQGSYDPAKSLLQFSLHPSALEYANETGAHEAFHFLQQAFAEKDPKGEAALAKVFKPGMTLDELPKTTKTRLQNTAYPVQPDGAKKTITYWDQLVKGQGGADKPFDSRAEAEAHVFGAIDSMRNHGVSMAGLAAPTVRFSKFVSDFKTRLGNGLRGAGLQTPEEVLEAYSAGKAGGMIPPTVRPNVTPLAEEERPSPVQPQEDWRQPASPYFSARKVGDEYGAFPAYSALERGIEAIPQNKADADQWAGIIGNLRSKGVKQDEIDWSGVGEWLADQKGQLTKDDVLGFLRDHQLKLDLRVKGGEPPFPENTSGWNKKSSDLRENGRTRRVSDYTLESGDHTAGIHFDPATNEYIPMVNGEKLPNAYSFRGAARAINEKLGSNYAGSPAYEDWTSPGAHPGSYREAFITAPESERYDNWVDGHARYSDVQNPVARIRYDTRTTPDGKRTMHVAEIQPPRETAKMPPSLRAKALEMGAKWALYHAARNGYDSVSWDTGETNRVRYGKAYENISSVRYNTKNKMLEVREWGSEESPYINQRVDPERLDEFIPKEFVRRLMDKPGVVKSIHGKETTFQGTGLKHLYDQKLPRFFDKYARKWGATTSLDAPMEGNGHPARYVVEPDLDHYVVLDDAGLVQGRYENLDDAEYAADRLEQAPPPRTLHKVDITPQMRESIGVKKEEQPLWSNRKTDFDGDTPLPPEIAYSRREAAAKLAGVPGLEQRLNEVYAPIPQNLSMLDRTKNIGLAAKDNTFWKRLYMRTVDEGQPLAKLDTDWAKKNVGILTPGKDILERSTGQDLTFQLSSYKMRSMVNRSAAHAGTDMFTAPFALEKTGDFTTSRIGPDGQIIKPTVQSGPYKGRQIGGLMEIWAPAYKAGVGEAFHFYMDAKRGLRLIGEGREQVFKPSDKALADQLEKKFDGTNGMPDFKEMAALTHEFNKMKMDGMVKAGVITRAAADHYLSSGDYTPFYRDYEKEGVAGPVYINGVNTGESVLHRKLKGGEAPLADPIERWYRHLQALNHAMVSNESAARAMDQAIDLGVAKVAKPGDDNVVTVRRNGDKVQYSVQDPLLYESLAATDGRPMSAMMKIFQIPTNVLRQFTTHVPTFILMHAMRESMTGFVTGDFKPLIPIIDAVRGIKNSLVGSASAKAIQAHGITGNFDYRPNFGQTQGDALRAKMASQLGIKVTHASGMGDLFHKFWGKYENVLKAADAGVRTRVYEIEMAKHGNPAEAAYQAGAKAVNFQRRGSSPFMSYAFSAIPFLNARIQGTDLILRTAYNQGKNRGLGGVLFSRGMALAAITGAYYMAMRDNDAYKKASSVYKDGYWIIPMDMFGGASDEAFVLPIPFEAGVIYKNVPEHIMRYFFGDDTSEDLHVAMETALLHTLQFNPIPQLLLPGVEVAANHSFYTGRQVVPEGMQMPGARQYEIEPSTSLLARKLGAATHYSPIDIDYLVRGYLGTVGEWAMEASDVAGRWAGEVPPLPDQYMDNPAVSNAPFVKRFVRSTSRLGNEEVDRLYDLHGETQGLVRTINRMTAAGDADGIQKLIQENPGTYGVKDATNAVFSQVSQLNKMAMTIQNNPKMSGAEKDRLIKMISDRKAAIAHSVETLRAKRKELQP